MRRRTALAAIAGAALGPMGAVRAHGPHESPLPEAFVAALRQGEAALARGDAEDAAAAFDRAAAMRHASESELGLVRAGMQRGRYREALAFCSHVAGAHKDHPAATALYVWMLRVGGQGKFAGDLLTQMLARAPKDASLLAARDALAADWPVARGVLLERPARVAPESWLPARVALPLTGARTIGSGVVVDGGTRALIPAVLVPAIGTGRLWVRNGLGQTTVATIEETGADLAVLRLTEALAFDPEGPAAREPFAGSPGFVFGYAIDPAAAPAWPFLWQGFLGMQPARGPRPLGIDMPSGNPGGGPVLDAAGRVAGIALAGDGGYVFVPASQWPRDLGAARSPATPRALMPLDEAYERGMLAAVQVIAT